VRTYSRAVSPALTPRPPQPHHLHPRPLLPPAHGRDDTHGYGTQSRFLTAQAEALCERIDAYNTAEPLAADHAVTAPAKVQVDLANLWR
jgi:hypothetical protein